MKGNTILLYLVFVLAYFFLVVIWSSCLSMIVPFGLKGVCDINVENPCILLCCVATDFPLEKLLLYLFVFCILMFRGGFMGFLFKPVFVWQSIFLCMFFFSSHLLVLLAWTCWLIIFCRFKKNHNILYSSSLF